MHQVKDKVHIFNVGNGWIAKIWKDELGVPLFRILLNDSSVTPDGFYLVRGYEFVEGWK